MSSKPSLHTVLGNSHPLLAVKTATTSPVNDPNIATNSAPNTCAYTKADTAYTIPIKASHGKISIIDFSFLFFPKKITIVAITIIGMKIPLNKSNTVICSAVDWKND